MLTTNASGVLLIAAGCFVVNAGCILIEDDDELLDDRIDDGGSGGGGGSVSVESSEEEDKLYDIIMQYRETKGLPRIPKSKSLYRVAQTHARDQQENYSSFGSDCNMHSWSDKGNWTACCYTANHAMAQCMWDKPRELTNYKGNGYEISYGGNGTATAEPALAAWKGSSGHNAVIVNSGAWQDRTWKAIGIGIRGGYADVWFGEEPDKE